MAVPESVAEPLAAFAELTRRAVQCVALYAGGSVATGDYCPATSDLDLVAIIERELAADGRARVRAVHREVAAEFPAGRRLGCVYIPRKQVEDLAVRYWTWSHGRFFQRPLSGIGRADLRRHGVALFGPPIAAVVPDVTADQLRPAVRAELLGYWSRSLRWPWIWWRDDHVDLALLTMARATAALSDGSLITKSEAVARLPAMGVPPLLIEEITQRRAGLSQWTGPLRRLRRARTARRITASFIRSGTR